MSDDPRKQQSQQQPRRQTPGRGSSGDSGSAGTASSSSSAQYPLNDGSDVATFTPVNQVTYLSIGPRSVGPSLLSSAPGGIASHFAPSSSGGCLPQGLAAAAAACMPPPAMSRQTSAPTAAAPSAAAAAAASLRGGSSSAPPAVMKGTAPPAPAGHHHHMPLFHHAAVGRSAAPTVGRSTGVADMFPMHSASAAAFLAPPSLHHFVAPSEAFGPSIPSIPSFYGGPVGRLSSGGHMMLPSEYDPAELPAWATVKLQPDPTPALSKDPQELSPQVLREIRARCAAATPTPLPKFPFTLERTACALPPGASAVTAATAVEAALTRLGCDCALTAEGAKWRAAAHACGARVEFVVTIFEGEGAALTVEFQYRLGCKFVFWDVYRRVMEVVKAACGGGGGAGDDAAVLAAAQGLSALGSEAGGFSGIRKMPPPLGPLPKPAPEQAGMEDEKQGSEADTDAEAKDMTFLVNMLRAKELEARLEGALIAAEISSSDVQEASLLQNEAVVAALSAALNIALSAPAVCHASCRTRVAIASALSKLLQYGGSEMCGLIDSCACEETAAQHLPERLLEVACLGLQCQQGHSASGSGRAQSWFEGYQQVQ
eukprot:TRINITY_DN8745_c0_g3_i2.p1 TRINITY_DN8745_c0_g3~~TRINITY_DN8745_c0_g3_i2.p1  ORF type:complete len:599 (-),score=192.84 TRINITY_DN8745_c0_g3_i2:2321-4117(-)